MQKLSDIKRRRKNMPQVNPLDVMQKPGTQRLKVDPKALKPSQEDFNYKKVKGMAEALKAGKFGNFKRIVVSKDGFIVDGHHRWKAWMRAFPGKKIAIVEYNKKRKEALDEASKLEKKAAKSTLDKIKPNNTKKEKKKAQKDLLETGSITAGTVLGARGGLAKANALPINNPIARYATSIAGGAVIAGAGASLAYNEYKGNKDRRGSAVKGATGALGQALIPIPFIGTDIGKSVGDAADKKIRKTSKEKKQKTLQIAAGAGAGGGLAYGAVHSKKGLFGKEKKLKPLGNVNYVIEGPAFSRKGLGTEVYTLDELKKMKSKGKTLNSNLIGILGGKSLLDKKYQEASLKDYTTGKVLNDFKTTQTGVEDQWTFYKNHEDSGMMPETVRADQIKNRAELEKKFGKGGYIAKKRVAYAGRGVLSDEKSESQLENINKGGDKKITNFDDVVGDKNFIFQKKMDIRDPTNEFRATIANGEVVDLLQRDKNKELNYFSRPKNP